MTKQEIMERIDRLEALEFYLQMKDRWDAKDFDTSREYNREIRELKKMLED